MSEQPEALRLADNIEAGYYGHCADAAAELRRLHAENEALKIDAECFRFWVREAANAPCDMANLIAKCITEQDYRYAIMPVAFAAEKVINVARAKAGGRDD